MKTYTDLHNGKEVFLELPFKVQTGWKVSKKTGKKNKVYSFYAPSLNEIIRLCKKTYNRNKRSAWSDWKKEAEESLGWEIRKQTKEHFDKRVGITFQRHAVRLIDPDSLGASFKLIGDTLTKIGVIDDDDMEHVKFYPEQYKVEHYEDEKIIVKIWEMT